MTVARKPRVVRKTDLNRLIDFMKGRDEHPAAYDLLPGGIVRVHLVGPAHDIGADDGSAEWDAALGV